MSRRVLIAIVIVLLLSFVPSSAQAVLTWAPAASPGTWDTSTANWYDGLSNVVWSNLAPDVALFGTSQGSATYNVLMPEPITVNGITMNKHFKLGYDGTNPTAGGSLTFNGASPFIETYDIFEAYCNVSTATGSTLSLNSIGSGTSSNVYVKGTGNVFDGSIDVGATAGTMFVPTSLGGDSSAGITIHDGSTIRLALDGSVPLLKPLTIAGTGYGNRGALQLYTDTATRTDVQGSVTLAADATIQFRYDHMISGPISGNYALTLGNIVNKTTAGSLYLTNAANSVNSLTVDSHQGGLNGFSSVYLEANFAASGSVTVGDLSYLYVNAALSTPVIVADGTGHLMLGTTSSLSPTVTITLTNGGKVYAPGDYTTGGYTLTSGQTIEGNGTALYQWFTDDGANIDPGLDGPGKITFSTLDMSGGGNLNWQLGVLADDATGVAGTDWDEIATAATRSLALGGTSQLTLDLSLVASPDSGDPFWNSDHTWLIADVGTAGTTGNFASILGNSFTKGTFSTAIVGSDVVLSFDRSATPTIPGATDGANVVDAEDAAVVAGNWGANVGEGGFEAGDFNGDHVVNAADAAIQVANWGSHAAGGGESTAVPEPSAMLLLLGGVALLLARRRSYCILV